MRKKPFILKRRDIAWRRAISPATKVILAARTAGRCEFRDCPRFLFRHPVTGLAGTFAELAHIIAFSKDGPRGRAARRPSNINDISNLMLLCPPCHKLVDDREDLFPIRVLREYKRLHEKRVWTLTNLKGTNVTAVVKLLTRVRGQDVEILDRHIDDALYPRFSERDGVCNIDLRGQGELRDGSLRAAADAMAANLQRFYGLSFSGGQVGHVSVFALAPIPLLVHLGAQLSTKVTTDLYQRHRDTSDWKWKTGPGRLKFAFSLRKKGADPTKVALIVSVSGQISPKDLPANIRKNHYLYEIAAASRTPQTDLLKTRADLERFRQTYEEWQGHLARAHQGQVRTIELFAAVPAPIAIALGWARLPEVAPALRVYDNGTDGFKLGLEVK